MTNTTAASGVTIVMATFNGEDFLHDQIESIRRQTHTDWRLIIRDDGSTDRTGAILKEAAAQDERIRVWLGPEGNIGPRGNFGVLLSEAGSAEHIFCADQDDVWDPGKVERSMNEIRRLEADAEGSRPLMVFTDYRVVDTDKRVLRTTSAVSEWIRKRKRLNLASLLGFNYVWGCTTVVNRHMLDAILPVPAEAQNADYWMALVAASVGGLHFLDGVTLDYKKHQTNVTGGANLATLRLRFGRHLGAGRAGAALQSQQHDAQMRVLRTHLRARGLGQPEEIAVLEAYVGAIDAPAPLRLVRQYRIGARQRGLVQEAGNWVTVLRAARS